MLILTQWVSDTAQKAVFDLNLSLKSNMLGMNLSWAMLTVRYIYREVPWVQSPAQGPCYHSGLPRRLLTQATAAVLQLRGLWGHTALPRCLQGCRQVEQDNCGGSKKHAFGPHEELGKATGPTDLHFHWNCNILKMLMLNADPLGTP